MEDSNDIILRLYPHKGEGFDGAAFAIAMPENKSRLLAARRPDTPEQRRIPCRQERAGTELPVERGLVENTDCLVLRFSDGARSRVGVVGGRDEKADLTFSGIPGISAFHLAFTFDDQNRPIVRDLGSTCGTKVTYSNEKGERLSTFDWLLQGPSIADGKPPILNVTDLVQFKVIVPSRDITSSDYIERVNKFRLGTVDPDCLFASITLQNATGTRLPSAQRTPSIGSRCRPILYKQKLGQGTFGIVNYIWNVTTGDEYVVKRPLEKLIKTNNVGTEFWKVEAAIMGSISHDHIVKFRGATFSPWPELKFEYIRRGSLESHFNLTALENAQILCQLSSALEYLHSRQPSIAHRDIKPENILVVDRGSNGINVKFADFGLSKASDVMKTFCGSLYWAAPEIYLKVADPEGTFNDTYSVAVDIWSLGVVIASSECGGLPYYKQAWMQDSVAWIHALQNHFKGYYQKRRSELLWFLLDNMLVEDPEERSSADYCHGEAIKILQHITDAGSEEENDEGTINILKPLMSGKEIAETADNRSPEASTFRPGNQAAPPCAYAWEALLRQTETCDDENLVARCHSLVDERKCSEVPEADSHPSRPGAASVFLQQESIVQELLWDNGNCQAASQMGRKEKGAAKTAPGKIQLKRPTQRERFSNLARHCPSREAWTGGVFAADETTERERQRSHVKCVRGVGRQTRTRQYQSHNFSNLYSQPPQPQNVSIHQNHTSENC